MVEILRLSLSDSLRMTSWRGAAGECKSERVEEFRSLGSDFIRRDGSRQGCDLVGGIVHAGDGRSGAGAGEGSGR